MKEFLMAILYQPIWNALVGLYNLIPGENVGVAIIVLTVLIKVVLFPFSLQSLRSQKAMQAIQPKLDEIKKKYKGEKEKLAKAMMEVYAKEKVSPLSSCIPLLIQLPILIALYMVLRDGLVEPRADLLYTFVSNPGALNPHFLGMDLAVPSIIIALGAGIAQFFQTKLIQVRKPPKAVEKSEGAKDESMMGMVNKQMLYVMPIITVVIGAGLPGGLVLYWFTTNVLTVFQQMIFVKHKEAPKPS
jgi:YidC/Oxa1 family membrane protein insertase